MVHDGAHGLRVDAHVDQPNRMTFPHFNDLECALRAFKSHEPTARFMMAFDIKSAHRLVPIHRRDWGLQACRLEDDTKVYLNTRGTFGVASAAFWWGRLAGLAFRIFHRVIPVDALIYLLLFADDGLALVGGPECHRLVLGLFMFLEQALLGSPLRGIVSVCTWPPSSPYASSKTPYWRTVRQLSDVPSVLGEVFRVDAMADADGIAIGSWETFVTTKTKKARWSHLRLDRTTAPFLYVKGEPLSILELVASTVALMVFGPSGTWRKGAGRIAVTGFTDNLSNSYLLDKFLTTKFPACLVLMELSKQMDKYDLDLSLTWIPREQNEESDDLSKERFQKFDVKNRVEVNFATLDFLVLRRLLDAATELDAEICEKKSSKTKTLSLAKDKTPADERLRLTQPW